MKKYSLLWLPGLLLVFLSVSCAVEERPPADLIPEEEMIGILQAIFIAEVKAVSRYELKMEKHAYMKYKLYPALFDSLGVADSAFYRSYDWYESDPARFEIILDSVAARVERTPVVLPDSTETKGKSLDQVYRELDRIESVKSGESRQPFKER